MSRPSLTVAGSFSDSIRIQKMGNSANTKMTAFAVVQRAKPDALFSVMSALPPLLCERRPEPLDEEERDDRHHHEDRDGDRRAEPEVEPVQQLVVAEHRPRLDVRVVAVGDDERRVEDPERVEG